LSNPNHSERVDRLHQHGLVDMHFDLPMDLYEKRQRHKVIETDVLPDLLSGDIGVLAAAIYIEDRYLPEMGLRVALDQAARLHAEVEACPRLRICRSFAEISQARQAGQIAFRRKRSGGLGSCGCGSNALIFAELRLGGLLQIEPDLLDRGNNVIAGLAAGLLGLVSFRKFHHQLSQLAQ